MLEVSVKPLAQLADDVKYHLNLMPSTCVLHANLIHFLSAFMNYKGHKLLAESGGGGFRKPAGDVVISCFPKIYDNPDVLEELALCWVEDVLPQVRNNFQTNVEYLIGRMRDYITRVYPILYSEEFKTIIHRGTTSSACASPVLLEQRKRLVRTALRYGQLNPIKAQKPTEAPAELTTFTPFSVRELDYEVWDTTRAQQDKFFMKLDEKAKRPSLM